jgi:hypothetical protein
MSRVEASMRSMAASQPMVPDVAVAAAVTTQTLRPPPA